MKKFLLVIFLASSLISNAQENTEYQYCELVGTMKLFSLKVNVSVDFGEDTKWFADTRIKDEITGKAASFNSMIDALNYMSTDDWEFVQAYAVTMGQQNVYHWLLKRKVDN